MKTHFHIRAGTFFLILLMSLSFSQPGFAQVPEKALLDYPEADKNMQTVKKAMEAYETGDWDQLRAQVTEDARFYNLGSFDSLTIAQTVEYWKKGREAAIPVLSENEIWLPVSVKEGPRKGNWVLHWGSNTLSYPNGETISFAYHIATRLEDGKISHIYFYYDNNRIIRALGYSIDPPLKEDDDDQGLEDFKEDGKQMN